MSYARGTIESIAGASHFVNTFFAFL